MTTGNSARLLSRRKKVRPFKKINGYQYIAGPARLRSQKATKDQATAGRRIDDVVAADLSEDEELICDEDVGEGEYCPEETTTTKAPSTTTPAPEPSNLRHIRPCICDLTDFQREKIKKHHEIMDKAQMKYEKRVAEIEAQLRAIEEATADAARMSQEERDLYGDEYEDLGKGRKKRKKRSARRASMVSLGVKQVINWKRAPKYQVNMNRTAELRQRFPTYCNDKCYPLPEIRDIPYQKKPTIPIRANRTCTLRAESRAAVIKKILSHRDTRVPWNFGTCNGIIQI